MIGCDFGGRALKSSNPCSYLADIIEEVIEMSGSLNVSFHHIRRTANDKADQLAKEGVHRPE